MRELLVPYEVVTDPDATKSKIIVESAKMFAVSGYSTVSVRDIATAAGITPGSIYAHFLSKQEILETLLARCEQELYEFYDMLERLSWEAESFEEIIRNLFAEPVATTNPFSFYVLFCAMTTQFEFEASRHLYYDVYFDEGHKVMCRQLEIAVQRGFVPSFNIPQIASLITNTILSANVFHVGQLNGHYKEFDLPEWYNRQITHILSVVKENGSQR